MVDNCLPVLLRCPRYLSLLFMVILHGIHASNKEEAVRKHSGVLIQKMVGETVELIHGSPTEGMNLARWNVRDIQVIEWGKDQGVCCEENAHFKDRVLLNSTNFNLIIKDLTVNDSGVFSFVSESNGEQRPTSYITLEVHEFMRTPLLTVSIIWHAVNKSCTVSLECSATGHRHVIYNWLLPNQSNTGPSMQFSLTPSEGDTTIICTASDVFSNQSASQTVTCDNPIQGNGAMWLVLYVALPAGCSVIVVIITAVVAHHCMRRKAGGVTQDSTIYADVTDNVAMKNVRSNSIENPNSVYETINDTVELTTTMASTIYDKIKFDRPTGGAASPLQHVC